jgi:hypothetical protein
MGFKDFLTEQTERESIFPLNVLKGESLSEMKFSELINNTDEERLRKAEEEVRTNPPRLMEFANGEERLEFNFKSFPSKEMKRHKGYIVHKEGEIKKMYCDCKDFYYRLWTPLVEAGLSSYTLSSRYTTAQTRTHTQEWTNSTNPDGQLFICKHLAALRKYI